MWYSGKILCKQSSFYKPCQIPKIETSLCTFIEEIDNILQKQPNYTHVNNDE